MAIVIGNGCSFEQEPEQTQARPEAIIIEDAPVTENIQQNVLLIIVDDMGYTDIGSFGSEIKTPNLDELAFAGVRLTNFHSAPTCGPTRAMLISGMTDREALKDLSLKPNVRSLPELLRDAGYHTYMAGKWQNGGRSPQPGTGPLDRGFEKAFARARILGDHFRTSVVTNSNGNEISENGKFIPLSELPEDFYDTNTFSDKVIEYIDGNLEDGKPWFTWLAYTAPHLPLQVPDDWLDRYKGVYDEGYDVLIKQRVAKGKELNVIPANTSLNDYPSRAERWDKLDEEAKRRSIRAMEIYAAMIENIDFNVGRLLDYLKQSGQFENTLILFMSDNGAEDFVPDGYRQIALVRTDFNESFEHMGKENSYVGYGMGWAEAATAPFKWTKGALSEGGTRVTAFAHHPSIINKGSTDSNYLTAMDILPTVLDVADVELPSSEYLQVRGHSFWPRLHGATASTHNDNESIPYMFGRHSRAIVRGDWKLIYEVLRLQKTTTETEWELYNLANDPGERQDLSEQQPELMTELMAEWEAYAESIGLKN